MSKEGRYEYMGRLVERYSGILKKIQELRPRFDEASDYLMELRAGVSDIGEEPHPEFVNHIVETRKVLLSKKDIEKELILMGLDNLIARGPLE